MVLVEREITLQNVERARNNSEFEQRNEIEHKLTPSRPELVRARFLDQGVTIEQLYLSTPTDEFSLRLRRVDTPEGTFFSATQKDRGEMSNGALKRTEIATDITEHAYEQYAAMDIPRVRKIRTTLTEGVSIDFYDDESTPIIVEVEHKDPDIRAQLLALAEEMIDDTLVDHTDDPAFTNEAIAFKTFPHGTHELSPRSPESLDTFAERVTREMVARYVSGKNQIVVGLTGMSGSGKTTVTQTIQQRIVEAFGEVYKPIIISTDDYHFGKAALEARYGAPYTAWDSPQTYNTIELAADLQRMAEGTPLIRRHFDFETEEPIFDEEVTPSPFVIVEGLYAGSKDLHSVRDLHFELPTSIATSVGRDVRRLVIDGRANRVFPTPESRLRYQIETALPLYLSQERPGRNLFSASVRPLAERAFMLGDLTR